MSGTKSRMAIIVLIATLTVLSIHLPVMAQDGQTATKPDFAIKHGTKALQFQLGNGFSLRTDQSLTLAYKYFLSSNSALRFGIGLSDNFEDRDTKFQTYSISDTTIYDNDRKEDYDTHSIGVTIQYLKVKPIAPSLNLIYAIGPYLGFARVHSDYKENTYDSTWTTYNYTSNTLTPGISCTLGAEWFIRQRISLSADYGFALSYSHRTQKEIRDFSDVRPQLTNEYTVNAFGWNSMATNMGINVYF